MPIRYIAAFLCTFAPVAAFDAKGAAKWALGCVDNCPECTCKSNGGGAGEGFCAETSTCDVVHCACGCTPFVSTALIEGGNWKKDSDFPGKMDVCAEFQNFMEGSSNWKKTHSVRHGDVVVMTTDKYAGHCCIGTGPGVMSCHNRAAKNVSPLQESHTVDGIYRHVESQFWNESELVEELMEPDTSVLPGECSMCKDAMNVVANLIFNTYACDKSIEEAIKLVCDLSGPFKSACKEMITLVCKACKDVTKDHCSWQPLAADACQDMGFC